MSPIVQAPPRDTRAAARAREKWAAGETARLAALGDRVALAELRGREARGGDAPVPRVEHRASAPAAADAGRARMARAGSVLVRLGLDPKLRPELRELAAVMATLVRRVELVESGADDQVVAGDREEVAP